MKNLITLLVVAIIISSCNKEVKKTATPAVKDIPLKERPIPALPGTSASNTVIGGAHYICPKNCIGGTGTAAGNCPICQTEMAHNQGFHVGNNSNTPTPAASTTTPTSTDGPNANGQFHYTCEKGCAGGAGKSGPCSNCGEALTHNTAYHS